MDKPDHADNYAQDPTPPTDTSAPGPQTPGADTHPVAQWIAPPSLRTESKTSSAADTDAHVPPTDAEPTASVEELVAPLIALDLVEPQPAADPAPPVPEVEIDDAISSPLPAEEIAALPRVDSADDQEPVAVAEQPAAPAPNLTPTAAEADAPTALAVIDAAPPQPDPEPVAQATEPTFAEPAPQPIKVTVQPAIEQLVRLPWDAPLPDDPPLAQASAPADDLVAEPPALAFAPAFLAVDEDGQPVPDEVVDHLSTPIPSLPAVPLEPDSMSAGSTTHEVRAESTGGSMWTIPLICMGIAIIACCLLIPQADSNGRLVWEREKLRRDLEQIQKQVDVNDAFLLAMADDQILTQRLAQRQMNVVRAGTAVLELDGNDVANSSPFQLVTVAPPDPLPEYRPHGGRFAALCRNPQTQLYLIGGSLLLIGAGLVLGRDPRSTADDLATV